MKDCDLNAAVGDLNLSHILFAASRAVTNGHSLNSWARIGGLKVNSAYLRTQKNLYHSSFRFIITISYVVMSHMSAGENPSTAAGIAATIIRHKIIRY